MSVEIWKDVPGMGHRYRVSSIGNVISKPRRSEYTKNSKNHSHSVPGNIMSVNRLKNGYPCVTLCVKGIRKNEYVHRLVALAHVENPNNFQIVNHINGIKTDNRCENLEWCTLSENCKHAYRIGLTIGRKGSICLKSRRPVAKKDLNGEIIALFGSIKEASKLTGESESTIVRHAKRENSTSKEWSWCYV